MENKEHWITNTKAIQAKNIFELARNLDAISKENFVFASQVFQTKDGYDCLIHIKVPPKREDVIKKIEEDYNNQNKPTEKQIRFLKEHKFKIENNLTKFQATKMIKDYIERLDKNKVNKYKNYEEY